MPEDLVLHHTSDAVLELDADLRLVVVNPSAALLFRRRAAELVGQNLFDLGPDLAREQLLAAFGRQIPSRLEIFYPGLFSWHSVLLVPAGAGRLLLFCRDVTERVRREQEETVRSAVRRVIEHIPLCVTITRGPRHRIEMANAGARDLVENRPVDGELLETVLPEAREQGFVDMLDRVYASRQTLHIAEAPLRWRPSPSAPLRESFFDLTYQPLFGPAGDVTGILHLGSDVTEKVQRRLAAERLGCERNAVLEQISEGVIITDAAGRITFVNAAAEAMHGSKLLGVAPLDYAAAYHLLRDDGSPYPSDELPLARAALKRELSNDETWRIRRPDGSILRVRGSARPVFGGQNEDVLACVLTFRSA